MNTQYYKRNYKLTSKPVLMRNGIKECCYPNLVNYIKQNIGRYQLPE